MAAREEVAAGDDVLGVQSVDDRVAIDAGRDVVDLDHDVLVVPRARVVIVEKSEAVDVIRDSRDTRRSWRRLAAAKVGADSSDVRPIAAHTSGIFAFVPMAVTLS